MQISPLHIAALATLLANYGFFWASIFITFRRVENQHKLNFSVLKIATTITFILSTIELYRSSPSDPALMALILVQLSVSALYWWGHPHAKRGQLTCAHSLDEPSVILRDGPYRFVRHPFYTAYLLAYWSVALTTLSPPALTMAVVMTGIYLHAAFGEERKLAASSLGDQHAEYKSKTGMFVPKAWRLALVIGAIAILTFQHGLDNPLIFDDVAKISENPDIRTPEFKFSSFIYPYDGNRVHARNDPSRPLTFMAYWAFWHADGGEPWPFHAGAIFIHALSALLIGLLATRLSGRTQAAYLAALWFLLLPINAGTVIYAYGFSDVLATFFVLAALSTNKNWAVAFLFLLALASKQSSIVLPGVIVIFDYFLNRRRWPLYGLLGAVALAYLLTRFAYFGGIGDMEAREVYAWPTYFGLQGVMIVLYALQSLVPLKLSVEHALNPPDFELYHCIVGWIAIALLSFALAYFGRRRSRLGLLAIGWLTFLLALLPTSSFFATTDLYVERRVYMPSALFIAAAGALLWLAVEKRRTAIAAVGTVLAIYGYVTWTRVSVYGDEERLWKETIALYPRDERARLNLSTYYLKRGFYEKGRAELEELIKIYPTYFGALINLGALYQSEDYFRRNLGNSLKYYELALAQEPNAINVRLNIGYAMLELRRLDEAENSFRHILRVSPRFALAHYGLARVYQARGDRAAARRHIETAYSLDPNDPQISRYLNELK